MEITMTIDDSIAKRVIEDVCAQLSYSETLQDGNPNPESKSNFTARSAANYLIGVARKQEVDDVTRTESATYQATIATETARIESELAIQYAVTKEAPAAPK